MELYELNEIIDCLAGERTKFYYFRDRYALMLLKDYILEKVGDKSISVAELKRSPFANLLNKAPVKKALSEAGSGNISAADIEMIWDENPLAFTLTLDQWGSGKKEWKWNQMSRSGYHLVLQLNMATDHTEQLQKLIRPDYVNTFNYYGHPSLKTGDRGTLAWVRMDLDFATNEVLIEEIQCDWIRRVRSAQRYGYSFYGDYSDSELDTYASEVLEPYAKLWQEAMLAATIDFVRNELGIKQVYYHSFENGARLKNIEGNKPPRSLYTKLPKQFGFKPSWYAPEFLMRNKKIKYFQERVQEPCWFTLPNAA